MCKHCESFRYLSYKYCPLCGNQLESTVVIDEDGNVITKENKIMSSREIFELFLNSSKIPKEDVVDYRYCTEFYAGFTIPNAIIIQLNEKYEYKYIVYSVYKE